MLALMKKNAPCEHFACPGNYWCHLAKVGHDWQPAAIFGVAAAAVFLFSTVAQLLILAGVALWATAPQGFATPVPLSTGPVHRLQAYLKIRHRHWVASGALRLVD